jgi:N-acetyl-anhydromuramyl-L-alanine amidase AmpD
MNANSISTLESSFRTSGIDAIGKKFNLRVHLVNVDGFIEQLKLIDCVRANGDKSFYIEDTTPKDKIVLHVTSGYLNGDVSLLTQPDHQNSVPFLIARNGDVYNLWSCNYWSYHLAKNAIGGDFEMNSSSIGIQISNIGKLKKIGDNLVTAFHDGDVYCTIYDESKYSMVEGKDGYEYYATFSIWQYKNLKLLLHLLCQKFSIPFNILPECKRHKLFTNDEARNYKGICSHTNFSSVKSDIGPAFSWDRIL